MKRSVAAWLEDFRLLLVARGNTAKHVRDTQGRVTCLFALANVTTLDQIGEMSVQRGLGLLRAKGRAAETLNHYIRATRSFVRFAVRNGGLSGDPLGSVRLLNVEADRRHVRRALTVFELRKLIAAAETGPLVRNAPGRDRAHLYELAATTGLRAGELRSLRVGSLLLDGRQPLVVLGAAKAKNRKAARQPVPAGTARRFRLFVAGRKPGQKLFAMPAAQHVAGMMRRDLAAAGIAYQDEEGRRADFHCLRHTYITTLVQATPNLRVVQELARHSTIVLTQRYAHVASTETRATIESLPPLHPAA